MKQSIDLELYVPSEATLEKLRRALCGEYDVAENTTTAITTSSETQIKERKNES